MTDPTAAPDSPTRATPITATAPQPERSHTLYRSLAWVGIVAGVVFIVGVVFAAGVLLGGGYPGWHRGGPDGSGPGLAPGGCPMMKSGAMTDGPMKEGPMREGMQRGVPGPLAPERIPSTPESG